MPLVSFDGQQIGQRGNELQCLSVAAKFASSNLVGQVAAEEKRRKRVRAEAEELWRARAIEIWPRVEFRFAAGAL